MSTHPAGRGTAREAGSAAAGTQDVTHSAGRWLALVAIAASVLVVGLDLTVLNLALPNIAVSLHASTADLQWIVDAYSLVLAALILPAGLLGDRYGRKRVLVIALVLFGASSLACAYATSTGALIASRAVLGIGAAAIFPLALSVLPVLFEGADRQRAVAARMRLVQAAASSLRPRVLQYSSSARAIRSASVHAWRRRAWPSIAPRVRRCNPMTV